MRCVWLCVFLLACAPSDKNVDGDTDDDSVADTPLDTPDSDTVPSDTDTDTEVDTEVEDTGDTDPDSPDTPDSDPPDTDSDTDVVETDLPDTDTMVPTGDTAPVVSSVISDIQTGVYQQGDMVSIPYAIVSAEGAGYVFIQDAGDGAPWSGVYVVPPSGGGLFRGGTAVSVEGVVRETVSASGSRTEVVATTWADLGNTVVPLPVEVSVSELADPALAEPWEGVRVSLSNVRVWEGTSARTPIIIGDAQDQLVVDPALFHLGPTHYGDTIEQLTGIVDWRDDRFVLLPVRLSSVINHQRFQAPIDMVSAGDIVVTEWMPFAAASVTGDRCADPLTSGQYIEIVNLSSNDINLDGMFIWDFTTNQTNQLRQSIPMPAGARIVGFSSGDANCYGLDSDFTYNAHTTGTAGFALFNNQDILDEVDTTLFTLLPGVSVELTESNPSASRNDDVLNWCDAVSIIDPGTTDRGTPGAVNDCP